MRPALLLLAVAARAGAAAAEGAGAGTEAAAGRSFAVAAYLPEWRYEGANWEVICTHTSHLILFSLEVAPPALAASQVTPKRCFLLPLEKRRLDSEVAGVKGLLRVQGGGMIGALDRIPRKELLAEARAAADRHGTKLLVPVHFSSTP